jgi:hypothetical protein
VGALCAGFRFAKSGEFTSADHFGEPTQQENYITSRVGSQRHACVVCGDQSPGAPGPAARASRRAFNYRPGASLLRVLCAGQPGECGYGPFGREPCGAALRKQNSATFASHAGTPSRQLGTPRAEVPCRWSRLAFLHAGRC